MIVFQTTAKEKKQFGLEKKSNFFTGPYFIITVFFILWSCSSSSFADVSCGLFPIFAINDK